MAGDGLAGSSPPEEAVLADLCLNGPTNSRPNDEVSASATSGIYLASLGGIDGRRAVVQGFLYVP